jgi:hypothetical protein
MKVFKIVAGMIVVAASMVAINSVSASATASNKCDVVAKQLGHWGESFNVNSNKITATFEVSGQNCTTPVTLAIWKAPSANGQPINEQKLFGHTTNTFGPGVHTLTTTVPNCFWQADLLKGDKATAPDGTANYAYQNGQILKVHPLRDFKYGGQGKCEEPEDVCPNIDGDQAEVPEGHEVDGEGNCVVPEEPETPEEPKEETPEVKGEQTPTVLPETGAGAVAATFMGVSTSAGIAHAIVRRFRK